jgi:O-antigen/teichoic acid export membrane protein
VYWGALFMAVGVLFGIQQESTRAVSDAVERGADRREGSSLIRFAGVLGSAVLLLLVTTGLAWAAPLFGTENEVWVYPLAIAVGSYVGVAALNGILAGAGRWSGFAAVSLIDGVLRLILVAAALLAGADGAAIAWAVAIPFPVSLVAAAIANWATVRSNSTVRESYRALSLNAGRTIAASSANAVLVNGFPVILSLLASSDRAALGAVVLALTLTRAPILVPLTALQSMLISRFSASPQDARRLMATSVTVLAVLAPLLAAIAGLWGPGVLHWLFGAKFVVSGVLLAWLVIAAGCLGLLTITGARILAAGRHTVFAAGWVVACLLAIAAVAGTPGDVGTRTAVGLILGPLVGAAYHVMFGRRV